MKRVLYLSYDGMTDPLGQSQVLPYLIGLTEKGYSFTLISFEKPDKFKKDAKLIQDICTAHDIHWVPLNYTKKPPILSTLKDIRKMRRTALKLNKQHHFDIVHARGTYITSLVAMTLKQKFGTKYLFDMRGFWADERVEGNLWNINKPHYKSIFNFFKRKEREFIAKADGIITLTEKAKDLISNWEGVPANVGDKIKCIPCCADLSLFDYNNYDNSVRLVKREQLNIPTDSLVFCYLGSIGTWYMLDEMLLFFKAYLKIDANAIFLFVSNENKEEILKKSGAFQIPPEQIRVVQATRSQVPEYLKAADLTLFFIRPTFSKQGSSPVKHGETLGMGLPAITNLGVGDMELITKPDLNGICIDLDHLNQIDLKETVQSLLSLDKQKVRQSAFAYYDLKNGILAYSQMYNQILTNEVH